MARLNVTSPRPSPADAATTIYFSSSPVIVNGRFCSVPVQFGNVLYSIFKVVVLSASLMEYLHLPGAKCLAHETRQDLTRSPLASKKCILSGQPPRRKPNTVALPPKRLAIGPYSVARFLTHCINAPTPLTPILRYFLAGPYRRDRKKEGCPTQK